MTDPSSDKDMSQFKLHTKPNPALTMFSNAFIALDFIRIVAQFKKLFKTWADGPSPQEREHAICRA